VLSLEFKLQLAVVKLECDHTLKRELELSTQHSLTSTPRRHT